MAEECDYEVSDNEIDEVHHEKLVENVLNLHKIQNIKKAARIDFTHEASKVNLLKSASNVNTNEVTKGINYKRKGTSKKLKYAYVKSKAVPAPLEKPQAEQIRRTVNYERSRLLLDRWEAFVTSNRAAATTVFPLDSVEKIEIEEKRAGEYPSTWKVKSDLQKELEKLEKCDDQPKSTKDEELTFALTYKELKERRKLAAKLRIHQSYKEAKARKQSKIKSKKYHRILKREKIKQKLKEFEELQKTNPEEAVKKLEEIDKARAEERFSLRHKGTGQWARNKQIRAKYDKESRQVLAQQLALSRELTQKLKSTDSDSEEDTGKNQTISSQLGKDNIWVNDIKPNKDVAEFVSNYRKYWEEHNKNLTEQKNEESNKVVRDKTQKESEEADSTIELNARLKSKKKVKSIAKEQSIPNEGNFSPDSVKNVVQEEYVPTADENAKQNNTVKIKTKKNKGTKRKLEKNEKDSVATSEWQVTKAVNHLTCDIEDMFDKLETDLNKKAQQKYKQMKENSSKKSKLQKSKVPSINNRSKYTSDLTMHSQSKKQIINEELLEQPGLLDENGTGNPVVQELNSLINTINCESEKPIDINPENFPKVQQTTLNTALPNFLTTDENEEYSNEDIILEEAFNDDDILREFQKEKSDAVNSDKPKDISLELPGWGHWGGTNIPLRKRKKKRFIIKAPPQMPRKDQNKGSLIINEKAQEKIKPLLVSELPFPFKTIKDYEASIRAPIGNTFVPETAFRRLIEPAIITKMGSIIEPVSKNMLIGNKSL